MLAELFLLLTQEPPQPKPAPAPVAYEIRYYGETCSMAGDETHMKCSDLIRKFQKARWQLVKLVDQKDGTRWAQFRLRCRVGACGVPGAIRDF